MDGWPKGTGMGRSNRRGMKKETREIIQIEIAKIKSHLRGNMET